jgi:Dolichyl-phosphate-mannose-protein mannosyltransferase
VARPGRHVNSSDTVVEPAHAFGWPADFSAGSRLPQLELSQAPLYYYALAPVAVAFDWKRKVFALRMESVVFLLAGVLFLFLAVRETAPERPRAAGLAAIVLATMSGLTYTLSQVQNDALLYALFALVYWLLCRDIPRRRASFGLAAAAGCLAMTQVVAVPLAAAAILWACWRATEPFRASLSSVVRYALPRLAVAAVPTVLWLGWNVVEYSSLFPGGGGLSVAATAGVPRPAITDALGPAAAAVTESFTDFWGVGFVPRHFDPRPAPLLCFAFVFSGLALLSSGMATEVRVRIAAWTGLTLAAFISTFGTLFLVVVRSGGYTSFTGRYFVGAAVAWAALVAVTVDAASRRVWLSRAVSVALALLLVRFALQFSPLDFRLHFS